MCSMTVCTRCSYRQSTLHESFAVDTFGIPFNDFVLSTRVAHCSFLSFSVTSGTEIRNVGCKRRRIGFGFAENPVRTMTFLASGSIRVVLCNELSMCALLKLKANFCVTRGTIHFFLYGFTRSNVGCIDIRVTLTARDLAMTGGTRLAHIDIQRPAI